MVFESWKALRNLTMITDKKKKKYKIYLIFNFKSEKAHSNYLCIFFFIRELISILQMHSWKYQFKTFSGLCGGRNQRSYRITQVLNRWPQPCHTLILGIKPTAEVEKNHRHTPCAILEGEVVWDNSKVPGMCYFMKKCMLV